MGSQEPEVFLEPTHSCGNSGVESEDIKTQLELSPMSRGTHCDARVRGLIEKRTYQVLESADPVAEIVEL